MGITNDPILKLNQVQKSYGEKTVLHDINLQVEKGDFIAIVGKSGCGKSTLLRIIAGLEPIQSGQILVKNELLQGRNPFVKIMFQDGRLLPWKKIYDNIGLGLNKKKYHPFILQLLEKVELREHADKWPHELSGGQKQRVALARALIHEPELLLLDEPLGALDALTRIDMQQLIYNLWNEKQLTAVLVTHDVEEAVTLANRVILIENGSIVMDQKISLPYPRRREDPQFSKYVTQILNRIFGKEEMNSVNNERIAQ